MMFHRLHFLVSGVKNNMVAKVALTPQKKPKKPLKTACKTKAAKCPKGKAVAKATGKAVAKAKGKAVAKAKGKALTQVNGKRKSEAGPKAKSKAAPTRKAVAAKDPHVKKDSIQKKLHSAPG